MPFLRNEPGYNTKHDFIAAYTQLRAHESALCRRLRGLYAVVNGLQHAQRYPFNRMGKGADPF